MDPKQIETLLRDVQEKKVSIEEAVQTLRHLPFEDIGFARIDHHRHLRCGFPEVIFCPFKSKEQVAGIFSRLARTGNNVLATRADQDLYAYVREEMDRADLRYEPAARMIVLEQTPMERTEGHVAIVTAGTADYFAAAEAQVTAEMMGCETRLISDVGVAGLHRLLGSLKELQKANVIIVVAGMEGALASVVGGLVDCPVIAVPTRVGYGASFEGLSALLTMLNSCAAGVTVVNIDNGFGAAYAASLMQRKLNRGESHAAD